MSDEIGSLFLFNLQEKWQLLLTYYIMPALESQFYKFILVGKVLSTLTFMHLQAISLKIVAHLFTLWIWFPGPFKNAHSL